MYSLFTHQLTDVHMCEPELGQHPSGQVVAPITLHPPRATATHTQVASERPTEGAPRRGNADTGGSRVADTPAVRPVRSYAFGTTRQKKES